MKHTAEKQDEHIQSLPVIDIQPLVTGEGDTAAVANQLGAACRNFDFFYITGHSVSEELQQQLEAGSKQFFALPLDQKMEIRMARGGRAWRGYFPVGEELTSGKPDLKEGLYFGTELEEEDPRVQAGLPMHGRNLFPVGLPAFRESVLKYIAALTEVGHHLMAGIALSLGLEKDYFHSRYTADPLTLFRIFHYLPSAEKKKGRGTVGRGRTHRLRSVDYPQAGRYRRSADKNKIAVDRRALYSQCLRLQYRRYARPHDRRLLPLYPAPGVEREWSGPPFLPLLLRSELRRPDKTHRLVQDRRAA